MRNVMELLDRYLQAVKKHLPWQRQDDIIAELRANLEAQLEDKEAELGRSLTKEEAEEWLKKMGSPIHVAARYQRQQYLIGPAVFPTYWYMLRLVMAWSTVIYIIAKVIEIAAKGQSVAAYVGVGLGLPVIWLVNMAILTLVFAVIEIAGTRFPEKIFPLAPMSPVWSPADLPSLNASDQKKPRTFARALAEVIFGCLLLVWLLLVPQFPFLMFGPGAWYLQASPYTLAPVCMVFYWSLVALNAFELTWKIVDFARGAWQGQKRWRHLCMHALSLIPLSILLTAPGHVLILVKGSAPDAARLAANAAEANRGIHQVVMLVVAIVMLQLVWGIVRASLDAYRNRVAAIK
jgi:hypothetical protein